MEMGVGIIWFMPIHPIGEKNRKGTLGSYYSVKDYKAFNPNFGTLDEFKSLVEKIHKMGMYVKIDWVANHTAWDN
jgi:glycosidase